MMTLWVNPQEQPNTSWWTTEKIDEPFVFQILPPSLEKWLIPIIHQVKVVSNLGNEMVRQRSFCIESFVSYLLLSHGQMRNLDRKCTSSLTVQVHRTSSRLPDGSQRVNFLPMQWGEFHPKLRKFFPPGKCLASTQALRLGNHIGWPAVSCALRLSLSSSVRMKLSSVKI